MLLVVTDISTTCVEVISKSKMTYTGCQSVIPHHHTNPDDQPSANIQNFHCIILISEVLNVHFSKIVGQVKLGFAV